MHAATRPCIIALALTACGGPVELPPLIASSKYIDYHTDVDASTVCMDDHLAREDAFLESTAARLGIDALPGTIAFVWDPVQIGEEPWSCDGLGVDACYVYQTGDGSDHIVSRDVSNRHELVHWLAIRSLGRAHRVLEEGIAMYLGSGYPSFSSDKFPSSFKTMLAKDPRSLTEYRLAMHFVGSIIERHGVAKYLALRKQIPRTADPKRFAAAFEAEVGQSLDDALTEMSGENIHPLYTIDGCEDGEARQLAWTGEGLLDTTIESTCGDPWFHGTGFLPGRPGFVGRYLIDVPTAGYYELTLGPVPGGPSPVSGAMLGCTPDLAGMGVLAFGKTEPRVLQPGTYVLGIGFAPLVEARGEATVRLEYLGPPD